MRIFHDTQICILNRLKDCLASRCDADLAEGADWLTKVVTDFMTPYIQSMQERGAQKSITDSGWNGFFHALDSGEYERSTIAAPFRFGWTLAKSAWWVTSTNISGFRYLLFGGEPEVSKVMNKDDFLMFRRDRIALAMAMNHIQNDLRRALVKNGSGSDSMWYCIYDQGVEKCVDEQNGLIFGLGNHYATAAVPHEMDISKIRDAMRREIIEEERKKREEEEKKKESKK